MKSLIIGGSGQDGRILNRKLQIKGHIVAVLDRPPSLAEGLIETRDVVNSFEPDWVFNLAGFSSVAKSWTEPAEAVGGNTFQFAGLMDVLIKTRLRPTVIQASSSEAIRLSEISDGIVEEGDREPSSPYAISKAASTELARALRASHGVDVRILHLFNHESPLRPEHFVTQKIAKGVAEISLGQVTQIELGNIEVSRDWGYAPDYVDAMIGVAQMAEPQDFQVATSKLNSLRTLLDVAFSSVGINRWEERVASRSENTRPLDHAGIAGDFSKLKQATGWEPRMSFEQMIEDMVHHQLLKLSGKTTDEEWLNRIGA